MRIVVQAAQVVIIYIILIHASLVLLILKLVQLLEEELGLETKALLLIGALILLLNVGALLLLILADGVRLLLVALIVGLLNLLSLAVRSILTTNWYVVALTMRNLQID